MSVARFLALVALAGIAGSASARSGVPWDGNYVGFDIGGLRVGDNFQYKRFVWGLDADFDYWSAGTQCQTVTYAGSVPSGKYAYVSRENPDAFLLVGLRIGYGEDPISQLQGTECLDGLHGRVRRLHGILCDLTRQHSWCIDLDGLPRRRDLLFRLLEHRGADGDADT